MSDQLLVVSADCHASPTAGSARDYVDERFRGAYDDWLADEAGRARHKAEHTGEAVYGDEALADFGELEAVGAGGLEGAWDSDRRLAELEADGVAAEVLYPGAGGRSIVPFDAGLMTYQYEQDPALWWAGCQAYNRWLGDLCGQAPGRRAGVGLVTFDDLAATVAEVEGFRDRGLFGGVLLPSGTGANPLYNDPYYEPLWSACEDQGLPIHSHTGWTPNYGDHPGSLGIFLTEITWFAHRAFWLLAWSGVFERHPGLRMVMTEQGSAWIPGTLAQLDHFYEMPMFRQLRRQLPLAPSEYFARQCFVGASFLGPEDAEGRHQVGVDKLMWGSDYPHIEGTWPQSQARLLESLAGLPADEVAAIVGGNALAVYDFDRSSVAEAAARVGPPADAFAGAA